MTAVEKERLLDEIELKVNQLDEAITQEIARTETPRERMQLHIQSNRVLRLLQAIDGIRYEL